MGVRTGVGRGLLPAQLSALCLLCGCLQLLQLGKTAGKGNRSVLCAPAALVFCALLLCHFAHVPAPVSQMSVRILPPRVASTQLLLFYLLQGQFVIMRKASPTFGPDDFQRLLSLARLSALSHGEEQLQAERWHQVRSLLPVLLKKSI